MKLRSHPFKIDTLYQLQYILRHAQQTGIDDPERLSRRRGFDSVKQNDAANSDTRTRPCPAHTVLYNPRSPYSALDRPWPYDKGTARYAPSPHDKRPPLSWPQLHGRQWPKIRYVQYHLFPVAATKKQHGRGRRQNRRGLDDHLIIRFYTLTLESETPKGRGESAHTHKTDQRFLRDRGIRPVPEDRYPVYILCLGKSPYIHQRYVPWDNWVSKSTHPPLSLSQTVPPPCS